MFDCRRKCWDHSVKVLSRVKPNYRLFKLFLILYGTVLRNSFLRNLWNENKYFKNLGKTSLEQKTSLVILFLYFPLLQSCVTDLGNVAVRLKEVVDFGVSQLRSSAIKPRIKPLTDAFLSTSHNISEVSSPKFLIVRW